MAQIDQFLRLMVQQKGSDLHLTVGSPPIIRQHGELTRVKFRELSAQDMQALLYEIMTPAQRTVFEETNDVDFAYEIADVARFRVNVFRQRKGMGSVMRTIPSKVLSADDLGLPEGIRRFCKLNKGLVLVTGPTGSGKSTTLAAMIDLINTTRPDHILTIEDPVEFVHPNKLGLVNQREVGNHTRSFASALKAALREDPDVILVGEMRDLETMATAVTAAETGHLILSTLHTSDAASAINRLVDVFPPEQQAQIRNQLALALNAIVVQHLIPRKDGQGQVVAVELLLANPAVRNHLRNNKLQNLASEITLGKRAGMISLEDSLSRFVQQGLITIEDARARSTRPDELDSVMRVK